MKITVTNDLLIKVSDWKIKQDIQNRLTLSNPAFLEAEKMDRYTGGLERYLRFYRDTNTGLTCPRGFMRELLAICQSCGLDPAIKDHRRTLPDVDFQFNGNLRPYQQTAVHAVLGREFGVIQAPTGAGKTVIALAIIAARKQPGLIVVHTKELLHQWKERIRSFLGIPLDEIGQIGGGRFQIGEKITVAIVHSLVKRLDKVNEHIGFLIVDECHRTPSRTFTDAVTGFDCRYMLGLSATPYRRDGLTSVIHYYLGPVLHRIDGRRLTESGALCRADVMFKETGFTTRLDASSEYSRVLSELTQDTDRNKQIASDVAGIAGNGADCVLVLSDRKAHCQSLQAAIQAHGIDVAVLTGGTPAKKRAAIVDRVNAGAVKVLIATGQLIGEGFDCKGLSHLFLASPLKFSGRVIQYAGRILRPAPGKDRALILDYVDHRIGVLKAAAMARRRTYQKQGFSIE